MIIRKPPSEHEEWLEESKKPRKKPLPPKKTEKNESTNHSSGADKRFKTLQDDIQEYG